MGNLIRTTLQNSKFFRRYVKYKLASERAKVVLKQKEACKIFDFQAESLAKRLKAGVHKQLALFDTFLKDMKQHEKRWIEFMNSDQLTERLDYVRDSIMLQAIYTDGRSKDAERLIMEFDKTVEEIKELKSTDSVYQYIHTLYTPLFWEFDWEEFWWKLCVILKREFLAAMVLAWLFYCLVAAFTPDPEVTCTEWWDNLVYDACGVPPGEFDWEWFQEVLEAS